MAAETLWTRFDAARRVLARPINRLHARWNRAELISGAEGTTKDPWSEAVKNLIRRPFYSALSRLRPAFRCPVCGYSGPFKSKTVRHGKRHSRLHSKCVGCGASERHRMIHLVIQELFGASPAPSAGNPVRRSLLHVAPEWCLRPQLQSIFSPYHTCDLFAPDVDFHEDLQQLSFPDASYDAVLISRVLMIPPHLEACLNEIARVLKPGGVALIAEALTIDQTVEFPEMQRGESRAVGYDLVDALKQRFANVELLRGDRYPADYQLTNLISRKGRMIRNYPEPVRAEAGGYHEVVIACRHSE